jgi:heme-degrading monooxygenase HmoA
MSEKPAKGRLPMVTEVAIFEIDPRRTGEFEKEFAEGIRLLGAAPGSRGARLERCVEDAGRYQLRVEWDSLEAHVVHFRQSPLNERFHKLVDGFLQGTPVIYHFEEVMSGEVPWRVPPQSSLKVTEYE